MQTASISQHTLWTQHASLHNSWSRGERWRRWPAIFADTVPSRPGPWMWESSSPADPQRLWPLACFLGLPTPLTAPQEKLAVEKMAHVGLVITAKKHEAHVRILSNSNTLRITVYTHYNTLSDKESVFRFNIRHITYNMSNHACLIMIHNKY